MSEEHLAKIGEIRQFGDRSMIWTAAGWKGADGGDRRRLTTVDMSLRDVRVVRIIVVVAASIPVISSVVLWTLFDSGWLVRIGVVVGFIALAVVVIPRATPTGATHRNALSAMCT